MVPERLITADCHIAPPYELINELPSITASSSHASRRTRTVGMFSRPDTS